MDQGRKPARAFERFKPFLTLEKGTRVPAMICGIQETWAQLERGAVPAIWYERTLPVKFRFGFAHVAGLAPFAVASADDVPPTRRSGPWRRLLRWKSGYADLDLRQKAVLLRLLGMLGFYQDNEGLLASDPPLGAGRWDETASQYAYLRAVNPFMLNESGFDARFGPFTEVAERAPAASEIKLTAALKVMVVNLERGVHDASVDRAHAIAAAALKRLRRRLPKEHGLILESKLWRTTAYFPFLAKDAEETDRHLGEADRLARAARAESGPEWAEFARENLYAVLATRAVTSVRLRRPQSALRWLTEMVALDPEGAWQRFRLGQALAELGRLDEAMAELKECLRLAPPCGDQACLWLARCLERAGRKREAADWLAENRRRSDELRALASPFCRP